MEPGFSPGADSLQLPRETVPSPQFSVFEYLYRDASNYKVWGALLLRGSVTQSDISALRACLDSGEYFVAERVGVPALQAELLSMSGGATVDDHGFHEFAALRAATHEDLAGMSVWGDVADLLASFRQA